MKKIVLSLAIFTALSVSSFAQSQDSASKRKGRPNMRELNLTQDQESKMDALRDRYKEKRIALDTEFRDDMKKILTSEQVAKLESIERNRPNGERRADNDKRFNKDGKKKHNGRKGHRGRGERDLDDSSRQQLADLRKDYDEKKAAIEKSRVAPDTQQEQLKALRTQYTNDVQAVLATSKKNEGMERPHSVDAWMSIAPNTAQ